VSDNTLGRWRIPGCHEILASGTRPSTTKAYSMKLRKQRQAPPTPSQEIPRPSKPPWQEFLDPLERPNREDLGAQHDVFMDSLLEPVPMPRWLRGRRRARRDKLS
jgi:hypothetical protein